MHVFRVMKMLTFIFLDRNEAGEQLAARLRCEPLIKEAARGKLLVLSIPRGGAVVGAGIARALECDHEILAVKKISCPDQSELAMGAMAEDGTVVLNRHAIGWCEQAGDYLSQELDRVKGQLEAYVQRFRQGRKLNLHAKTVIVVDDGIATGETMKAAVICLTSGGQAQRPEKVLVATPVCSPRSARELTKLADRLVCLAVPEQFWAVGQFYWNFDAISDEDVIKCLSAREVNAVR